MGFEPLKKHLKDKIISPLYLFYGQEEYLKKHYFEQLKKELVAQDFADFNFHIFDASRGVDFETVGSALENLPVFAEKKLIVINDLDLSKAENRDALQRLIVDIPDYACLVIYFCGDSFKPDKRLALIKLIENTGVILNFERPHIKDLQAWALRHFSARKKQISRGTLEYFLEVCPNDMNTLLGEIEKICAYSVVEEITRRHIDSVASRTLEADVFELADGLIKGEGDRVFKLFYSLMEQQKEPVMILAVIGKTFSDLYKIKAALADGKGLAQTAAKVRLPDFVLKKYIPIAKAGSLRLFSTCIDRCLCADLKLKSSRTEKCVLLEMLLGEILSIQTGSDLCSR